MRKLLFLLVLPFSSVTFGQYTINSWHTLEANPDLYKTQRDQINEYMMQNYSDSLPEYQRSEIKAYLRFKHFWLRRFGSYSDEKLSYQPYYDAAISFSQNPVCEGSDPANWQLLGPFTDTYQNQGLISEVLYDPINPDVLLISSNHGGLWKFNPGSDAWYNVTDDLRLPGISATEIVRHTFHHNTLFASTGNGIFNTKYGIGILKSTDNGESWEVMQGFPHSTAPRVPKIIIDPNDNNPNDSLNMYAITHSKVYFTDDSGESWDALSVQPDLDPNTILYEIEIDSLGDILISSQGLYGYTGQCFKYSGGAWTEILTNIDSISIQRVKFTIPHNGLVFALSDMVKDTVFKPDGSISVINPIRRIYKSTDNGDNWSLYKEEFSEPTQKMEIEYSPASQHIYVGDIGLQGIDYATGDDIYISGSNYHMDTRDIKIIGTDGDNEYLICANDGGVSKVRIKLNGSSTNAFTNLNGSYLPCNNLIGLGIGTNDFIVTGAVHGHTFRKNSGEAFENFSSGDGGDCIVNPLDNTEYYFQNNASMMIGPAESGFYSGIDWFIGCPYEMNRNQAHLLYFGRSGKIGIYNINTKEVTLKPTALVNNKREPEDVGSIEISNGKAIYIADFSSEASTTTHRIVKSFDGGSTWQDISQNNVQYVNGGNTVNKPLRVAMTYKNINTIESDPITPENLWIGLGGVPTENDTVAYGKLRVVKTTNGGSSWMDFSEGLPPFPVNNIRYQSSTQTLFAATDVGVFYRHPYDQSMTQWECFSEGMPVGIVTELDINDCDNKIFASIDSRGIYESSIPFPQVSPNVQWEGDLLVSGTQEWNTTRYFDGEIIVNANSTLRINSNIYFTPESRIIVMPSGELFLSATLSTLPSCDSLTMWEGIQIRGNANMAQLPQHQGSLRTLEGAQIQNARIGVAVYGIDNNGNYMNNSQGGIIAIDKAEFSNCKVGIDIRDYTYTNTNTAYKPQIIRSNFSTNKDFYDYAPVETPIHIQILNNNEVNIAGCSFTGFGADFLSTLQNSHLPIGIKAWYSPVNIKNNTFRNLSYGVHALDITTALKLVDVDQNIFRHCINGVYLNTLSNPQVNRNEFYFENNDIGAERSIQVYFDQCPTFTVEENYFELWRLDQDAEINYGIIVNNCGSANNIIYKNHFATAKYAILAQGENRDASGANGLTIKCNSFLATGHGEVVSGIFIQGGIGQSEIGMAKNQGSDGFDPSAPAGNIFQEAFGSDKVATHLWNLSELEKTINYYYHAGLHSKLRHEPGYNNQSDKINGIITIPNNDADWLEELSCPSNFSSNEDEQKERLQNAEEDMIITSANLSELIDAGETEALYNEISMAESEDGYFLRNELLSTSPYLSDTVLENASLRENVLTNPLLRDILVANPQSAKNPDVLESVDNRSNPMPNYMKQQILNGQTITGAKEQLEAELHLSRVKYSNALNHLMVLNLKDSTINPMDSIIPLLETAKTIVSRYQLAGAYLAEGNQVALTNTLNTIVSDFDLNNHQQQELQNISAYYSLLQNVMDENRDIYSLTETEKTELMQWYNDSVNLTSALARNLLIYLGELDYVAPVILPDFGNKSALVKETISVDIPKDEYADLKIYPNPAKEFVICEYNIKVDFQQAHLNIIETETGRIIKTIRIKNKQNAKTIDLSGLNSGNYMVSLEIDNSSASIALLNIIY